MTRPVKYFITITCGKIFSWKDSVGWRKGKYPVLGTNMRSQQIIKHTKMSYCIAWLVFCKFLCIIYRNGLNPSATKLRHSNYLKKCKPCNLNSFWPEFAFYVCARARMCVCKECGTSKLYHISSMSSFSRLHLITKSMDARP